MIRRARRPGLHPRAHHVQIFLEDNLPTQKTAMAAWDSMTPPGHQQDGSAPRQHHPDKAERAVSRIRFV